MWAPISQRRAFPREITSSKYQPDPRVPDHCPSRIEPGTAYSTLPRTPGKSAASPPISSPSDVNAVQLRPTSLSPTPSKNINPGYLASLWFHQGWSTLQGSGFSFRRTLTKIKSHIDHLQLRGFPSGHPPPGVVFKSPSPTFSKNVTHLPPLHLDETLTRQYRPGVVFLTPTLPLQF
jgi:hypothetical protein